MNLCFNDILFSFSYGLDCVEHDLVGVSSNHSKRVAYMSVLIGKLLHFSQDELIDIASCAVLHDNALTEYINEEMCMNIDVVNDKEKIVLGEHALIGEENVHALPFRGNVKNAILYHHENADATGPFSVPAKDTSLFAQIIHITDIVDVTFDLSIITKEKYSAVLDFLKESSDTFFASSLVNLFTKAVSYEKVLSMDNFNIAATLKQSIPRIKQDFSPEQLVEIAKFFACIIDYKSTQTASHSLHIASKMARMARFYNYDDYNILVSYLAGALHDVGKLTVDRDILEKKGKLTPSEYEHIKSHAIASYNMLASIEGFDDVTLLASSHHEKLNGSGYPFKKDDSQLGQLQRTICAIDIYQALREKRSYKQTMTHKEVITLLNKLVVKGELDKKVIADIDFVFANDES
ncbi:MAG: HD domain-containing protein [Oscillospiraceae bacterium]